MLHPVTGSPTCATAWLAATKYLTTVHNEAYNLVVDIDDPARHSATDQAVIVEVDQFLRTHNANPIVTVANTIFPQDLYRRYGAKELRAKYLAAFGVIRKKGWGRYFQRMIAWPKNDDRATDQLAGLIGRLRKQFRAKQTYHNVYEMTLFDPATDSQKNLNRQCLSFLSFKLHPERGLMLTAMYRNHYYIARALGNFIGLGNLMAYIAAEVGASVGPLTCVSTHAVVDAGTTRNKANDDAGKMGWTLTEVKKLLARVDSPSVVKNVPEDRRMRVLN